MEQRFEPHYSVLGLGGAKCDGCKRELGQGERVLVAPAPQMSATLHCAACAKGK